MFIPFEPGSGLKVVKMYLYVFVFLALGFFWWSGSGRYFFIFSSFMGKVSEMLCGKKLLSEVSEFNVRMSVISYMVMFMMLNYMGLMIYVFSFSSYLCWTFSWGLSVWGVMLMVSFFKSGTMGVLSSLTPLDSPYYLMSVMVVIELVSLLIRPLTLSVRMFANIMAGHLLMGLVGGVMVSGNLLVGFFFSVLLAVLETVVSLVQSYVFCLLFVLYGDYLS